MLKDVLAGISLALFILGLLAANAYVWLTAMLRWLKDVEPDADQEDADCDSARSRAEQEAFFTMVL
jgi:hypothetical protein